MEAVRTIRTDPAIARQIEVIAKIRGISEEELVAEVVAAYSRAHATEHRAALEKLVKSAPSRRTNRVLRALCSPGGAAALVRLYPPGT